MNGLFHKKPKADYQKISESADYVRIQVKESLSILKLFNHKLFASLVYF